ncbi:MAG: hypothetical protein HFG20_01235 [Anaerotruncus sp.]|nr:hypothetical protein [Anaerotruncus sp.]
MASGKKARGAFSLAKSTPLAVARQFTPQKSAFTEKSSARCGERPKAPPLESAAFEKAGETFGEACCRSSGVQRSTAAWQKEREGHGKSTLAATGTKGTQAAASAGCLHHEK